MLTYFQPAPQKQSTWKKYESKYKYFIRESADKNSWSSCRSPGVKEKGYTASGNFVNIESGIGLSPDGTKSLPEPLLTNHQ